MYDIHDYGGMINDSVRMTAYIRSLRSIITPESVVLDIGTGPGIFALMACQLGARKVYAIEPMDVIELAKELAEINNFSERITFIQDRSANVELPEAHRKGIVGEEGIKVGATGCLGESSVAYRDKIK